MAQYLSALDSVAGLSDSSAGASPPSDPDITPAAVACYGPDLTTAVDGPVIRDLLAEPVQEVLNDLGHSVPLVGDPVSFASLGTFSWADTSTRCILNGVRRVHSAAGQTGLPVATAVFLYE